MAGGSSSLSSVLLITGLIYLCILLLHDHTQASTIQKKSELFRTDQTIVDPTPVPSNSIDCELACGERCKDSSRPNLCKRACGTCCKRCGCVPPGTYGNYVSCPCYFNQTTHDGVRKCP